MIGTKLNQSSIIQHMMQYAALLSSLVFATVILASSQLSFKTENNESSILISSSTHPIDHAINHIIKLQSVIDKTKSIKAQRRITRSYEKAKNIRSKFIQMSGNSRHETRSIFDGLTDTSGLILGKIFGLASSKQTRQLSSSIKNIR